MIEGISAGVVKALIKFAAMNDLLFAKSILSIKNELKIKMKLEKFKS